jgi:hypothetical protein
VINGSSPADEAAEPQQLHEAGAITEEDFGRLNQGVLVWTRFILSGRCSSGSECA